jgi:DNA-binding winged helix-turn-helix (wHTH) protein
LKRAEGCQVVRKRLGFPQFLRLSFGPWTLDSARRQLLRAGAEVPLSPKAFDLLSVLAEHHDRAFSKSELHQHLWPDSFVSDGSLTILIAEIRQVLGDDAQRPQFVRTVQRFGHAFCAEVVPAQATEPRVATRQVGWLVWGDNCVPLAEGETIPGRAVDVGIRFDLPGVSRRHARICVAGDKVTLEDLGSRNGTCVCGDKVTGLVCLVDGNEIRLGPVPIIFRLISPDSSTSLM